MDQPKNLKECIVVNFADRLTEVVRRKKSVLVVGLDPQLKYMPPYLARQMVERYGRTRQAVGELYVAFNKSIIDAVWPYCVAVKPQVAFYEGYGSEGLRALEQTNDYAREHGLLVINDAKRGDGSDTAEAYADAHIGEVDFWAKAGEDPFPLGKTVSPIRADAVTIHPHIGDDCVSRFVARVKQYETGIFVVAKTSFKPNSRIEQIETSTGGRVFVPGGRIELP
jgi:orotidine-5'-phosphate decarboxylase